MTSVCMLLHLKHICQVQTSVMRLSDTHTSGNNGVGDNDGLYCKSEGYRVASSLSGHSQALSQKHNACYSVRLDLYIFLTYIHIGELRRVTRTLQATKQIS